MTQEAQDMVDTRALELATAANERATHVDKTLKKLQEWAEAHEKQDDVRFKEISDKSSKRYNGVYERIGWIVSGAFVTVITMLALFMDFALNGGRR